MTIADALKRNDFYELAKLTLDNNKEEKQRTQMNNHTKTTITVEGNKYDVEAFPSVKEDDDEYFYYEIYVNDERVGDLYIGDDLSVSWNINYNSGDVNLFIEWGDDDEVGYDPIGGKVCHWHWEQDYDDLLEQPIRVREIDEWVEPEDERRAEQCVMNLLANYIKNNRMINNEK